MLTRSVRKGVVVQGVEASSPPPTHSLITAMEGPYDPQSSSPLFATAPPEIRNRIFSFALYSYDDKSRPYYEHSYYSRPGYRYHQRISTALLETCRRIYTETHDLPISQNEHVFWCSASRGPPGLLFCDNPIGYFARFTIEQKVAVIRVHLHAQLFWLQGFPFRDMCSIHDIHPRHLKITVRHTDWWNWESNTRLVMNTQWIDNLKVLQKLEVFDIELKTIERDKDQMETIVKNMFQLLPSIACSRVFNTRGNPVTRERYMGTSAYGNGNLRYSTEDNRWTRMRSRRNTTPIPEQIPYVVSTIRWTAEGSD